MASLEYVEVPTFATRLQSTSLRPETKIHTGLPHPEPTKSVQQPPTSPSSTLSTILPQILLSSSIQVPPTTNDESYSIPGPRRTPVQLLSTRDPLSIPIATVNFKRFVAKTGPVFWFQDRVEEILMWRRGWKVTGDWIAAYAFLCMSTASYLHFILLTTVNQATFLGWYY